MKKILFFLWLMMVFSSVYGQTIEDYVRSAVTKFEADDYQNALTDINAAISMDPEDARFYWIRGRINTRIKDYKAAIEDCSMAIHIDHKYRDAYSTRAFAKVYSDDPKGAIKDFNRAIKLGAYYEDYFGRATARFALEEYEETVADCDLSLELEPKTGEVYLLRGLSKAHLNQIESGCQDLNQALLFGSINAQDAISKYCD